MLNTLIFLDDNYHSISTFPNVSSIKQLKQHFYYIWNKLENGIFYSCNLRSTYIKHCILNTPIYGANLLVFPFASCIHKAISFIQYFLWNSSFGHPCDVHNCKTKRISSPSSGFFCFCSLRSGGHVRQMMCVSVQSEWILWPLAAY